MKTTKKHFLIFKKECKKWIDYFGLKNWDIRIVLDEIENRKNGITLAIVNNNFHSRSSIITLNKTLNKEFLEKKELKCCAFHEIWEIILYPLAYLAEARFITNSEVEPEIHNIIRTLENTIFEEHYGNESKKS